MQSPRTEPERRNSARSPLFMLTQAKDGEAMWAIDIGLGGMQCRARTPRWPGTYVDLSFKLPNTRACLEVGAQVTTIDRIEGGEVILGLRFCRMSAGASLAIYRFLDRRRTLWSPRGQTPARKSVCERFPQLRPILEREQPFARLLLEAGLALAAA